MDYFIMAMVCFAAVGTFYCGSVLEKILKELKKLNKDGK